MKFDDVESKKILSRYSVHNLIRRLAGDTKVDIGFEREISAELEKRQGREARGYIVPDVILSKGLARAVDSTFDVGQHIYGSFLNSISPRTALGRAGMTTVTGIDGNFFIPKDNPAVAPYWVGVGNPSAKAPFSGSVKATPHTIGAFTDVPRALLAQRGYDAEGLTCGLLANAIAKGIDTAGFLGISDADGDFAGVANFAGVQSVAMTANAPTKAKLVEMVYKVLDENGEGANCFIGSPAVRKLLATTLDDTETRHLLESGKVDEFDFITSKLCGSNLYFADWSRLVMCAWGGVELIADKSHPSPTGEVRVVALQDVDFVIAYPKAFAVGAPLG